jgi:predicted nuclease with RNAse H fold
VRALGIDVGVRKGLDLVLLDESRTPVECRRRVEPRELGSLLGEWRPDVVGIDAPPQWGIHAGASRFTERELRRFGIQSFGTPSDPRKAENAFYEWMTVGFATFEAAARCGFRRYASGRAKGTAMEVFPHASAVVLTGCLPAPTVSKRDFRVGTLRSQGVNLDGIRSLDQLDATLAALTGLLTLDGHLFAPGDPREGVIVLPARSLPPPPYRRCAATVASDGGRQRHLPGMSPCACGDPGCHEMTSSEFSRGHDAKRKAMLWAKARVGEEAVTELRRRRWELPPEMR